MPRNKRRRSIQPNAAESLPIGASSFYVPIALALILLATVAIYFPALRGEKVWDDGTNITTPELQSFHGLNRIWFDPTATAQYYPLVHTAFWLEHKLWGDSVLGYHLVNLLWHCLAIVLVYAILSRLKIPGALLTSAIFAVHPVMVESVAWVAEQKNTLSACFYLGAMLVYIRFDHSRTLSAYFCALGLFFLALCSKTATVTLPAALLLIFWWQRGTLSWRRDFWPLTPFFAIGAGAGLVTAWVEREIIGAKGSDFQFGMMDRFLVAGRAVWFYLSKLLWPSDLLPVYPRWEINPALLWQWTFPLAVLVVTFALWAIRRRSRAPLTAWLYFCGTLLPVLGFLNVYYFRYSFVADHFQYLASLGIIAIASAGIVRGLSRLPLAERWTVPVFLIALIGTLATLSFEQSQLFAKSVGFYERIVAGNPSFWMAQNNLGLAYQQSGKPESAVEHFQQAITLKPTDAEAYNNLALLLIQSDRAQEAIAHLKKAIELKPDYFEAYNNLGLALLQLGRDTEAVAQYRTALKIDQDRSNGRALAERERVVLTNLGIALSNAGQLQEAVDSFQAALALTPGDPFYQDNLAGALARVGRFPEAREHAEAALHLQPNDADAHYTLGMALAGIGDVDGATKQFEQAIRIRPKFVEAYNDLGELFRRTNRPQQAIKQFQAALKIDPNFVRTHDSLGVTLAEIGKISESIDQFRLAIRLRPDDANAHSHLASVLIATGNVEEAISQCEQVIRLRPKSAEAHNSLAEALRKNEKLEQAIKHYQTAIQLQSSLMPAYAGLTQVLSKMDRNEEAIATAERGIDAARSSSQKAQAEQIEEWLRHFRIELARRRGAASSQTPSN
jgi:tetratricopeptide (TPR) repeat protein